MSAEEPPLDEIPTTSKQDVMLLRVLDSRSVCLMLPETFAVIHAELESPISPRSHANAQMINVFNPVPGKVCLGPYDFTRKRFVNCTLEAMLPPANYSRLAYTARVRR